MGCCGKHQALYSDSLYSDFDLVNVMGFVHIRELKNSFTMVIFLPRSRPLAMSKRISFFPFPPCTFSYCGDELSSKQLQVGFQFCKNRFSH